MPLNLSSLTAQQQAAAIYIGYYDRAPDPDGSTFWEDVVTDGDLSLADIAADFSTQDETRAEHPFFVDPTADAANAFISELYMNLFNRAPDVDGLEFWSGVLQDSIDGTGALSVGQIILEIIQGAQDTADGNDLTTIQNKIAVATAWTDEAEAAGLAGAGAYANDAEAQASAKSILEGVTDDSATVKAAESEAASFFAEGQTFTLTTGEDDLTGTDDDDVFNAPLVEAINGQRQTLNDTDALDGGEGNDRLNVTLGDTAPLSFLGPQLLGSSFGGETTPLISNIEQFFVRATGAADSGHAMDMVAVSGVEQLWNDRSTGELVFGNVQNGVVVGLNSVFNQTNINYAADVLGDDFTQNVVAQGAGTATLAVDLNIDVAGADDKITGLGLNAASGVNNIVLEDDAADVSDLTITGSAELMLAADGIFEFVKNVDATGYTGDLELDISGQEDGSDLNVALGAGDDSLTASEAALIGDNDNTDPSDDTATLDGGEGEDNLTVALASPASDVGNLNFENVTGFEQLTLARAGVLELPSSGELEIDLSETDFATLVVDAPLDINGELTVKGSEDFTTIDLEGALTGDGSVVLEGFAAVEINANANANVTTDLVADELTSATLNVGEGVDVNIGSLDADLLETLTVNLGEGATLDGPTSGVAAEVTTVTVTGEADSTVDYLFGGGDEASLATIDLSGMDGTSDIDFSQLSTQEVENDLSIVIGEGDLDYEGGDNNGDNRETFAFTGDDIGMIDISGFTSGVGGNGDRIDFSAFEAVSGLNDLDIASDGGNTTITAADGEFDGTITVTGADLSTDAFNFIF